MPIKALYKTFLSYEEKEENGAWRKVSHGKYL
jgi:hypothetical protein